VPAHLSALRRTHIGDLAVADAVALAGIDDPAAVRRAWRAPLEVLHHMPHFNVDGQGAGDLACGRATPSPGGEQACGLGVAARAGRLVALVRCDNGWLRPLKVFP